MLSNHMFRYTIFSLILLAFPCIHPMDKQRNTSSVPQKSYCFVFKNHIENQAFALILRDYNDCKTIFTLAPQNFLTFNAQELYSYQSIEFVAINRTIDPSKSRDIAYVNSIPPTQRYFFSISRDLEEFNGCNETFYVAEGLGRFSNADASFQINFIAISVSCFKKEKIFVGYKEIYANEETVNTRINNEEMDDNPIQVI